MIKIYLDDVRFIPDETRTEAKTPQDFYALVVGNLGKIEEISFDHDLGCLGLSGREITGYDCLHWFIETYKLLQIPFPKMRLHTANPVGRQRMETLCIRNDLYNDQTQYYGGK